MSVLLCREVIEEIFCFLLKIVNICLSGGWFSDALKVAKEVPLNKKGVKFHRSLVLDANEQGKSLSLTLCDLTFVMVSHDLLLTKLERCGFECRALETWLSYLWDRRRVVLT